MRLRAVLAAPALLLAATISLVTDVPAREDAAWRVTRLGLTVDLQPDEGAVDVDADILLEPAVPADAPPTIEFFLNRGLKISALDLDGVSARWSVDEDLQRTPFSPESRRITVPAAPAVAAGPRGEAVMRLHLTYGGRLVSSPSSPARISRWLTELNLYAGGSRSSKDRRGTRGR